MSERWREVTKANPCPACGKPDWCAWSPDRTTLKCERATDPPNGMVRVATRDGGALFRLADNGSSSRRDYGTPAQAGLRDWAREVERYGAAITPDQKRGLAQDLGVRPSALDSLAVGWAGGNDLRHLGAGGAGWVEDYPSGAYTFPERDGGGRVVGLSLRTVDGRKGAPSGKAGAKRGLIVPRTLSEQTDPVLMVEGASDAAACETLGLAAVGRPSNAGGGELLAHLLRGRDTLVIGERDQKPDGSWPGRDGAERIASRLATAWDTPVAWALPPEGAKDTREWLQGRIAAGLSLDDVETCRAAGQELLECLLATAKQARPVRLSAAEKLVQLALERYRIGLADGDEAFAVAHSGPNVALMFRGSRGALQSALAREYRRRYGTTPSASALGDALTALQGEAQECTPEAVHLRLARHEDAIVLDLGDTTGQVVIIHPGTWELADTSPVLFRRTALTGALPEPTRGGDIAELRQLLNVTDETWPLVLGWLVAALMPGIPHPLLMLGGQQGAGKSTLARLLVGLVDPSPAPLRSQPKDPEQWALAAAGSWCVAVDNVGGISPWWSDMLCKAVTGDAWVRRRLYTDHELSVVSFRRAVVLTSIDAGALRGDLGDRLMLVDLEPIEDHQRRPETELDAHYEKLWPSLFGALLDLAADVLARLPNVALRELPRMADFARVLAALDGSDGRALDIYLSQRTRIASDVVDGDLVGGAVVRLIEQNGSWAGTAGELLARITPDRPPRGWPSSPRAMAGRLRRLIPALQAVGLKVEHKRAACRDRTRRYTIRQIADRTVQTVQPSGIGPCEPEITNRPRTVPDDGGRSVAANRPADIPVHGPETKPADGLDGSDGLPLQPSEGDAWVPL